MPTPPRESIGGLTAMQGILFRQQQPLFEVLTELENLQTSEEFTASEPDVQTNISNSYTELNTGYESLLAVIDDF